MPEATIASWIDTSTWLCGAHDDAQTGVRPQSVRRSLTAISTLKGA
jgi:hypothetical protein